MLFEKLIIECLNPSQQQEQDRRSVAFLAGNSFSTIFGVVFNLKLELMEMT